MLTEFKVNEVVFVVRNSYWANTYVRITALPAKNGYYKATYPMDANGRFSFKEHELRHLTDEERGI